MKELPHPPKQTLIGPQALEGDLVLRLRARAIIVFAHGSGSGLRSPRNLQVAHALNEQRSGTLLFDLLRPEEALAGGNVFDIELLRRRDRRDRMVGLNAFTGRPSARVVRRQHRRRGFIAMPLRASAAPGWFLGTKSGGEPPGRLGSDH